MIANQIKSHICLKDQSKLDFFALQKKGHSNFAIILIQFYLTLYIVFIISIVLLEFVFFL